jgi:hypothetical protein
VHAGTILVTALRCAFLMYWPRFELLHLGLFRKLSDGLGGLCYVFMRVKAKFASGYVRR